MVKLKDILKEVFTKPSTAVWNGKRVEVGKIYANPMLNAFRALNEDDIPIGKKLRIFDFDFIFFKIEYLYM